MLVPNRCIFLLTSPAHEKLLYNLTILSCLDNVKNYNTNCDVMTVQREEKGEVKEIGICGEGVMRLMALLICHWD